MSFMSWEKIDVEQVVSSMKAWMNRVVFTAKRNSPRVKPEESFEEDDNTKLSSIPVSPSPDTMLVILPPTPTLIPGNPLTGNGDE